MTLTIQSRQVQQHEEAVVHACTRVGASGTAAAGLARKRELALTMQPRQMQQPEASAPKQHQAAPVPKQQLAAAVAAAAAAAAAPKTKATKIAKKRHVSKSITLELLESHYNVPLIEVAKIFGLSITMLKKVCRRYGIQRWPHRQIRSVNCTIRKLREKFEVAEAADRDELARQLAILEGKKVMVMQQASSGIHATLSPAPKSRSSLSSALGSFSFSPSPNLPESTEEVLYEHETAKVQQWLPITAAPAAKGPKKGRKSRKGRPVRSNGSQMVRKRELNATATLAQKQGPSLLHTVTESAWGNAAPVYTPSKGPLLMLGAWQTTPNKGEGVTSWPTSTSQLMNSEANTSDDDWSSAMSMSSSILSSLDYSSSSSERESLTSNFEEMVDFFRDIREVEPMGSPMASEFLPDDALAGHGAQTESRSFGHIPEAAPLAIADSSSFMARSDRYIEDVAGWYDAANPIEIWSTPRFGRLLLAFT
jgi:hypothetical protein